MKRLIYFLPFLIALSSCLPTSTVRFTVASTTADCAGVTPQKCLLVKKRNATEWEFFHSRIEGFSYEPGYEYVLEVKETEVGNTPSDAPSTRYELVKEISKTAKASENLPPVAATSQSYQWGGNVLEVNEENMGIGTAKGKIKPIVVKLKVTHTITDIIQPGDIIYCELIPLPTVIPVVGREYIFKSKNVHPAHAKGVYFLETDVMDLVV